MRASGLPNPLSQKSRDDANIQDIPCVDERPRSRSRELCEPEGSLLRGDESAHDVDRYISIEVGQWEGKRVLRRSEG